MLSWETYPALGELSPLGLRHAFSLRSKHADEELAPLLHDSIATHGWGEVGVVEAEQPHGKSVAVVGAAHIDQVIPTVDALITAEPGVVLAIRVGDCGPVWFYDRRRKIVAIAHSGKKGTEKNIVGETIQVMGKVCGTDPADLTVFLGPSIRPPDYEIDFAAEIGRQVLRAGVAPSSYQDCGRNTAAELAKYYSYRAEKGKTGRMWAVAMMAGARP